MLFAACWPRSNGVSSGGGPAGGGGCPAGFPVGLGAPHACGRDHCQPWAVRCIRYCTAVWPGICRPPRGCPECRRGSSTSPPYPPRVPREEPEGNSVQEAGPVESPQGGQHCWTPRMDLSSPSTEAQQGRHRSADESPEPGPEPRWPGRPGGRTRVGTVRGVEVSGWVALRCEGEPMRMSRQQQLISFSRADWTHTEQETTKGATIPKKRSHLHRQGG
jgi:hypothetical protein